MLRLCGDVSPSGLQDLLCLLSGGSRHRQGCVGRWPELQFSALNRSGRSWYAATQAGGQYINIRWRQPPLMAFRPEAET